MIAPTTRAHEVRPGAALPKRVSDRVVGVQHLLRRHERWWRAPFDALLAPTIEAWVQARLRRGLSDPGLWLGEERALPDEERVAHAIADAMSAFLARQYGDRTAERAGNTKTYGLVRGTFEVDPDLPPALQVGVFEAGRSYPVWVRCAGPGPLVVPDLEDNGVMSLAIKLLGVAGEKLSDDERHTQDFLFISAPTFTTPDALANLKLQQEIGRDRPAWYFLDPRQPHLLDAIMQGLYAKSYANPLEATYYSCVPYSFGAGRAVQYALRPLAAPQSKLPRRPGDDYLRAAMVETLRTRAVEFELTVQLQTDARRMPIENAAVIWPVSESPRRRVGRLRIPEQTFDSPAQLAFARQLRFDPWHALPEHRPLGNQNRVRRVVYRVTAAKRQAMNREQHIEPTGRERF